MTIHIRDPHWFESAAFALRGMGRRPATLREWSRCLWNADIFYGPVPAVKLAGVSWLIAWLA